MPKVVYTAAKGLIQTSGSGFEISDAAINQTKTFGHFLSNVDILQGTSGNTGDDLNTDGAYFNIGDSTLKYLVWITASDATTPATQPSGTPPYDVAIEVSVLAADTAAQVAAKVKTAVEAVTSEIEITVDGNGFDAEGTGPYEPTIQLSVPSILTGSNVTNQITGSAGNSDKSVALNPFGHNHIDQDKGSIDYNLAAASAFTLADGSFYGQRVTISANLDDSDEVTVSGKIAVSATGAYDAAGVLTFTGADTKVCFADLMWNQTSSGGVWLPLKLQEAASA